MESSSIRNGYQFVDYYLSSYAPSGLDNAYRHLPSLSMVANQEKFKKVLGSHWKRFTAEKWDAETIAYAINLTVMRGIRMTTENIRAALYLARRIDNSKLNNNPLDAVKAMNAFSDYLDVVALIEPEEEFDFPGGSFTESLERIDCDGSFVITYPRITNENRKQFAVIVGRSFIQFVVHGGISVEDFANTIHQHMLDGNLLTKRGIIAELAKNNITVEV